MKLRRIEAMQYLVERVHRIVKAETDTQERAGRATAKTDDLHLTNPLN